MDEKNIRAKIEAIQNASSNYFKDGKITLAISTYKELHILFPKFKKFYITYIQYLEDEFVISELQKEAYFESLKCCERAIKNLDTFNLTYFYSKKLELYIIIADYDFKWYGDNKESVDEFLEETKKITFLFQI